MSTITIPDDGGWTIAGAVMGHVQNVLLYGPPGTGKSTFGCLEGGAAWDRILCHEEMSDLDVIGGPSLRAENGGTSAVWQDGAGLRAWREGKRLVIDEVDKAGGAALSALLAILDDVSTAAYTIPMTGETVRPAAGFHTVATMNGHPDDLPPALQDRFTVRVEIDRPHPHAIDALPHDLRAAAFASAKGRGARRVSVRGWRAFATLRAALQDEGMAAAAVFGPDQAQDIVDALTVARDGGDFETFAAQFS